MIDKMPQPNDPPPSAAFYLRKAEELRSLAENEVIPSVRDQHLRIASMYQALADHTTGRPVETVKQPRPTITIPKGLLRSAS